MKAHSKNILIAVMLGLAVFLASSEPKAQQTSISIQVNASQMDPLMIDSATRPGVFIEIAQAAAAIARIKFAPKFYPWLRAMKNMERDSTQVIVGISRTPPREKKYIWIMHLIDMDVGFISLSRKINSYKEGKGVNSIGFWRGTNYHNEVKRNGMTNIRPFKTNAEAGRDRSIELLELGRLSSWYGDINEFRYRWQQHAKNKSQHLYVGKPIYSDSIWLAANLQFSKEIAHRLKSAMAKLKKSEKYEKIITKYFGAK